MFVQESGDFLAYTGIGDGILFQLAGHNGGSYDEGNDDLRIPDSTTVHPIAVRHVGELGAQEEHQAN